MKYPNSRWPILLIGLAFLVVAIFGLFSFIDTSRVQFEERQITKIFAIREATHKLLSTVKEIETAQRGFIITGQQHYLEPYFSGLNEIETELNGLKALIDDRPPQQTRVDTLEKLIEEKKRVLKQTIDLRTSSENPEEAFKKAQELVVTDAGKQIMDRIKSVTQEILDNESSQHEQKRRESNNRAAYTKTLIVGGNIMALLIAAMAAVAWRRSSRQREVAEQELLNSEAELGAIIESANEGIIAFDHDFRIRLMNPAAAKIHLCEAGEMIGRSLLDLVPERFRDFIGGNINEFVQSGETRQKFENGIGVRKDQTEFPLEGMLTRSRIQGWDFITLMFRDTSDQQQIETLIHQQGEFLDQIRNPIQLCDLEDRIIYWNKESEKVFGIPAKEACGKNVVQLIYPTFAGQWNEQRATLHSQGQVACEWQLLDKDYRPLVVELRRSLIGDRFGIPTAQLIINVDVTARKNEELRDRRVQRLESIGTLAGGVAHDLNNVLTPILMSAKLLKRAGTDREKLADIIVSSADHGSKMIKKLLAFAGGEAGERGQIDVSEIINESQQILRHTLPTNIQLSVACDQDLRPVNGDATEISQVLMNLAINARDAMPGGGNIRFRAENVNVDDRRSCQTGILQAGSYVQVMISDNGSGISPEIMDKIFDPFFTTKAQGKGTGLGLATTLGIVHSYGGEIQIDSEVGRGSRFTIYFPASDLKPGASSVACEGVGAGGEGRQILVVDDEPLILETAKASLELGGYRVRIAICGKEAVEIYQNESGEFDLVVLDVMLPGMDGSETQQALRAINPDVKIIASSGLMKPGTEGSWLDDVNGFLAKPYTDEQLLQVVSQVLHDQVPSSSKQ